MIRLLTALVFVALQACAARSRPPIETTDTWTSGDEEAAERQTHLWQPTAPAVVTELARLRFGVCDDRETSTSAFDLARSIGFALWRLGVIVPRGSPGIPDPRERFFSA